MVGFWIKGAKGVAKTLKGKKKVIDQVTGKPFSKATQEHMHKQTLRHKTMKQMGLKGPKYAPSGKKTKTGAIKLEEVWKYNPYKKASSKRARWGAHLKRRSRVFKEGQERHKALDIKEGKK